MRRISLSLLILIAALSLNASLAASAPLKLIFDTDIGNDIDDALALAVIHDLADRGEVELLAVTISKDNRYCAPFIDLVNTFYGRPEIPIGVVKNGKTPDDGKFLRPIVEAIENGKPVYPHKIKSGAEAPEAVAVLRKILASQPDHSVTLVSVGFLTNFARLLDSKPDENSPLDGAALIKQKVLLYCAMAGAFGGARAPEYNVIIDADASRAVFDRWPTPIIASGYEIGLAVKYPAQSIENDFQYVAHHPIAEAYRLYVKMPDDRPSWDLTAALYAIRPHHGYFGLSNPGKISLGEKNVTQFTEQKEGQHRFLTLTPEQAIRVKEALVELASSPPKK